MRLLSGLQLWHLFKYAELTEVVRQKDKLSTCLMKFELVTLMMMLKNYLRQDLYTNLMKTVKKMYYICMQRMNLP